MDMHLASGSGNVFGYFWADQVPASFDGPAWAKVLCPRGVGFGLDGIYLLQRPEPGEPWALDHWDADGAHTFCSNGNRAAMALDGAPSVAETRATCAGFECLLRRDEGGIGLRMPEGEGLGLRLVPIATGFPSGFGFIGNPQLVLRVPSVAGVNLAELAPPLRHHTAFPKGTNVNVVEVLAPGRARIRSWERGVEGETLCCGTGCAVASAWLAQTEGISHWTLETAGGDVVTVSLDLNGSGAWRNLWLSGPIRRLGLVQLDPMLGLG
jgi:diaminopimelate epimerase